MNRRQLFASAVIAIAWLPAEVGAVEPKPLSGDVLILAAASTTDAINDIRAEFMRRYPQVTVRTSFAASSTLAQQIDAGAPADLFLSASTEWADFLAKNKLVARRVDLLGNTLVVIVPSDSNLVLTAPQELAQDGVRRLALADPKSVPAGIYARRALEKLGLWKRFEGRVAGAADVRQSLKFVETGAADAGIVYASDVVGNKQVRVALRLSAELSGPIRYPLALLSRAKSNQAATAFYEYLASPASKVVFDRYGFIVLPAAGKPQTP